MYKYTILLQKLYMYIFEHILYKTITEKLNILNYSCKIEVVFFSLF